MNIMKWNFVAIFKYLKKTDGVIQTGNMKGF